MSIKMKPLFLAYDTRVMSTKMPKPLKSFKAIVDAAESTVKEDKKCYQTVEELLGRTVAKFEPCNIVSKEIS